MNTAFEGKELPLSLVAFIITYNHAPFIRRALESAIAQKISIPLSILVLEDGSSDDTLAICKEYEARYPRVVQIISQKKNTKGAHIKAAFKTQIKTKYWTLLEGDDFWTDTSFLEKAVSFLEKNLDYVAYTSNTLYKGKNVEIDGLSSQNISLTKETENINFKSYIYAHTSARVYRNIFDFSSLKNYNFWYDIFLYFLFLDKGKVLFNREVVSTYNISGNGAWSKLSNREKRDDIRKAALVSNHFFDGRHHDFFWGILPQKRYHKILRWALGEKRALALLYHICVRKGR